MPQSHKRKFTDGSIALSELPQSTDGKVLIAQTGAQPEWKALSGDATMDADGVVTVGTLSSGNLPEITGAMLSAGACYFSVAVATNGTTPVNVFGAGGAPVDLTVTSILTISKDTTAGNIVMKQAANTVATIAKSTTAGVPIGAASLANADYTAADVCTVESSSSGNAFVIITFTVA